MGSTRQKRARLPQRVYWVRRGMVLLVAVLLVFGLGKLFGGNGSDGGSAIKASTTATTPTAGSSVAIGPVAPSGKISAKASPPLMPPSGDCLDDEVSVLPSVTVAYAGQPVTIQLQLTGTQAACTFAVSPESMVVKIESGTDRIWSSQDCPRAVPTTSVVVRSGTPVQVPVTWSGRRSDDQCTNQPDWALPGFYHVYAAALGSSPTDVQFEVTRAPTRVVTRTPKPSPSTSVVPTPNPSATAAVTPTGKATAKATVKPTATSSAKPAAKPTGKATRKP